MRLLNLRTMGFVGLLLVLAGQALAGDGYEVTSQKDGETVTYRVNFGGGRRFDRYTAFDPATKTFVYLDWPRGDAPPEPAGIIWDHRSGELVPLYKFPKVEPPLPIIPSMEEMKVCPMTGDKDFKAKLILAYD